MRSRRYQVARYQRGGGAGGARRLPAVEYHIWPRNSCIVPYCAIGGEVAAAG